MYKITVKDLETGQEETHETGYYFLAIDTPDAVESRMRGEASGLQIAFMAATLGDRLKTILADHPEIGPVVTAIEAARGGDE